MLCSKKFNIAAVIAVLSAFCFVTAFSYDASVTLRGSRNLLSEKLDVYRCDANNERISNSISNKTEELEEFGFDVRVCFGATRLATSNNQYILKVDDFSFTKDRTNGDLAAAGPTRQIPAIMRQKAVDHGIALSDDLTFIDCEPGARVCAIETRLTGYFFLTSGTIFGKGSLLMQRGDTAKRQLQDIGDFEDVYIEIKYTGGGRIPMPPGKKRMIIIISIISVLLLICCCCGLIVCCMAGICCFAGRDREEEVEEEDIEEVSVKMEYAPAMKKSKNDEEDMSETESLEDDKYWDDEINLSDDENERDDDSVSQNDDDVEIENLEDVTSRAGAVPVPVPAPPFQDSEEDESKEKSKRKSKRNSSKSLTTEETRDYSDGNEPTQEEEGQYMEDDTEEIVAVPDPEETPRKKKKKKKKKKPKSTREE